MDKRRLLTKYFETHGVRSQQMVADLYDQSEKIALRKDDIVEWDTEHCIYFNTTGYQRLYVKVGDKQRNLLFIEPVKLVVLENKSVPKIDAEITLSSIAKSTLLQISKNSFRRLLDTYKDFERLISLHRQQMVQKLMSRCITLSYLSMEERFKRFVDQKFYLMQHIPHKHIASYLNIHPTNFSTLLRKTRVT